MPFQHKKKTKMENACVSFINLWRRENRSAKKICVLPHLMILHFSWSKTWLSKGLIWPLFCVWEKRFIQSRKMGNYQSQRFALGQVKSFFPMFRATTETPWKFYGAFWDNLISHISIVSSWQGRYRNFSCIGWATAPAAGWFLQK